MADIVSKIKIGTPYAIRSGYTYGVANTELYSNNSTNGYVYIGTIKDSNDTTIGLGSLYDGLTFYIRFHTAPLRDTVKLKLNGFSNKEIKYGDMKSPRYKITAGAVYALRYTVIDDVGYFIMVHSADTDTHYISTDVLAKTSGGTVNSTADTTNATTYLNHIENGSVRSSLQIIGSGSTSVSAKNGVLTIESVGGEDSSTDEKLTVATYTGTNYKQVVLHDGVGTNDIGYGSDNLKFHVRTVSGTSGGQNVIQAEYDELVIGKVTTASASTLNTHRGSIKLGRGHGTLNGEEIYGIITSPTSGQSENELPPISGKLLSSGGLLIGGGISISTELQSNSTYYQCLYKDGKIFSAGVASGQTVGNGNDYPETSTWYRNDGNAANNCLGPFLYLGSDTTEFPGLWIDRIPEATKDYGGIVTATSQDIGGDKTFHGDLKLRKSLIVSGNYKYIGGTESWNNNDGRILCGGIRICNGPSRSQIDDYTPIGSAFIDFCYSTEIITSANDTLFSQTPFITAKIDNWNSAYISSNSNFYLPATFDNNHYIPQNGTIGIITSIGTPTGLVAIREGNYLTTNGLTFGNDATKFLDNTGKWSVPAGGGGGSIGIGTNAGYNVFAANSIGTTNETVSSNTDSVYLNHIDASGSVVSSNIIQGAGITTVSANGGVLTITTPDENFEKGDFNTMGALIGFIGTSTKAKPISVQPARPDLANAPKLAETSYYTRQGVIKPMFETRNAVSEFHGNTYGGIIDNKIISRESECLAAISFVADKCKYIAIPIITDYWYNSYTQRYESVPYVLLPKTLTDSENGDITACYNTTLFTGDYNTEPSISTITHYPFDKTYNGDLVDDRFSQNNMTNI